MVVMGGGYHYNKHALKTFPHFYYVLEKWHDISTQPLPEERTIKKTED